MGSGAAPLARARDGSSPGFESPGRTGAAAAVGGAETTAAAPIQDNPTRCLQFPPMHIGAMVFPTDLSIRPDRLARELEARGYESLWVAEHTHIPAGRRTPYPAGGELPEEYRRLLDPYVALTAAAMVTERLRLGTGIALVAQHDPIVLAKAVASLDLISGGRVLFGIGVGWNEDEMEHHGVDPTQRRAVAREHVLAMRELWTQDEASFEGEYVRFSPSWSWPKPVTTPTRRSCWVAPAARPRSATCSSTATAGCPSTGAATSSRSSPSSAVSPRRPVATGRRSSSG